MATWIKSQQTLLGKDLKAKKYPLSDTDGKGQPAKTIWPFKHLGFLAPYIQERPKSKQVIQVLIIIYFMFTCKSYFSISNNLLYYWF